MAFYVGYIDGSFSLSILLNISDKRLGSLLVFIIQFTLVFDLTRRMSFYMFMACGALSGAFMKIIMLVCSHLS